MKTYFWEKCLDFILEEKKENLFQLFDDLGGKKEKEKYFCTVQFFL